MTMIGYNHAAVDELELSIKVIRKEVHAFFANLEWSNQEATVSLDDVNDLLEQIKADKIKRKFSGTVVFAFDFSGVEAEDEDDLKQVIEDATEIMFDYDHKNTYIQDITDVEEE